MLSLLHVHIIFNQSLIWMDLPFGHGFSLGLNKIQDGGICGTILHFGTSAQIFHPNAHAGCGEGTRLERQRKCFHLNEDGGWIHV
jgi:hypothetical protein